MITDGLEAAYRSNRLVYRAIENNEHDKNFLQTQIENDPINIALSDPGNIQPRNRNVIESMIEKLLRSILAVMVCLPGNGQADGGSGAKTEGALTPIGFVVLGWDGLPPDQTRHRNIGLGITLAGPYQNQGYGAEAINWALDWAFRYGGYHRVALSTVSYNERAYRLYKRLGFVEEGRSREAHWHDRKWYDVINFAMLESEWAFLRGI